MSACGLHSTRVDEYITHSAPYTTSECLMRMPQYCTDDLYTWTSDGASVFVAAPTPAVRSTIDILMVTTMALVWTVNSTLSWGCNYVMQ